jgi:hypothetical protein
MLFAQVRNQGFQGPSDAAMGGFLAAMFGVICFILIVAIIIQVFFILTCSRCVEKVSRRNRAIEPGACWLQIIPLFNLYYTFVLTSKVSESVRNEYESRRLRPDGDFGKQIGMWWAICNVASLVPYLGTLTGLVGLVLFIIYWVKVYGYSKELDATADERDDRPSRRRRDEDEREDDDRPRRNRRYDDEDDDDRPRKPRRGDDDDL